MADPDKWDDVVCAKYISMMQVCERTGCNRPAELIRLSFTQHGVFGGTVCGPCAKTEQEHITAKGFQLSADGEMYLNPSHRPSLGHPPNEEELPS